MQLVISVDVVAGVVDYPDPCLFLTVDEADEYIREHSRKGVVMFRRAVRIGKMSIVDPSQQESV